MDKRLATLLGKTYFGKNVEADYRAIVAADPMFPTIVATELLAQPLLNDGRCHATKKTIEGLKILQEIKL